MQFEYRTCEPDDNGENTRTCHCSEGMYINGNKPLDTYKEDWRRKIVEDMRNAWGQFYREGTFPARVENISSLPFPQNFEIENFKPGMGIRLTFHRSPHFFTARKCGSGRVTAFLRQVYFLTRNLNLVDKIFKKKMQEKNSTQKKSRKNISTFNKK